MSVQTLTRYVIITASIFECAECVIIINILFVEKGNRSYLIFFQILNDKKMVNDQKPTVHRVLTTKATIYGTNRLELKYNLPYARFSI